MRHVRRTAAAIITALTVLSCGDPASPSRQTFSIIVTGDVSETIEGTRAVFDDVRISSTSDSVWALDLSTGEPGSVEGVAFLFNGRRPAAGTYALTDAGGGAPEPGSFFAAVTVVVEQPASVSFLGSSTTGTLTITTSSSEVVRGTFAFQAHGTVFRPSGNAEGVVTVEGSFVAASGEIDFAPPGGPVVIP